MTIGRTGFLAAAIGLVCLTGGVFAQDKPPVDWATPGNAVPCQAWQKNEISEVWMATDPVTINGRKMLNLTLSRNAMAVGDTNVWQIVETACGQSKKG